MDDTGKTMEDNEATEKEKDTTYNIPFNMDELESLIDSALTDLDFSGMVESTFADVKANLNTQESQFNRTYLYL